MKKIALIIALALPGAGHSMGLTDDQKALCNDVFFLAEQAMKLRQIGASMPEALKTFAGIENDNMRGIAEAMVVESFQHPQYRTEKHRARAINDFSSELMADCYTWW